MATFLIVILRITVIFILQLSGALMVAYGLGAIWFPLCPVFCGAVLIFIGHRLYLQLESEGADK